jgi:hypothetical protein
MNYLNITNIADGTTITTEVRNVVLNRSVMVIHRAFDTSKMYQITLDYDEESKTYVSQEYTVDAESVFKIVTPERLVRVSRAGKGYWGGSGCSDGTC